MKLYLAGPMSGIPQFNFPAFEEAVTTLRGQGWDIISPHEQDSPEVREAAIRSTTGSLIQGKIAGHTWGEILAADVRIIADYVKGIVFLPDWHKSRGARLKAFTALLAGHTLFYNYRGGGMWRIDANEVRAILQDNMP